MSEPASEPLGTVPARREVRAASLSRRLTAMAMLVALICVIVTGVAMLGQYRAGASQVAARTLQAQAATVATTLDRALMPQQRVRLLTTKLGRRHIQLAVAQNGAPVTGVDPPFAAADLSAGDVSARRSTGGIDWLVEGARDGGTTVLLAQPVDDAITEANPGRGRLVFSLLVGLLAGAVAGLVLADQLGRPLRRLAAGARELSAGRRDVQLAPEGPAEVADVARALNDLGAALAGSEDRQRRFLMDVSHELRTPLTAVIGYAEGLVDGVIPPAEVSAAAEVISQEAARLGRRIEDLMALARMEADDFRVTLAPTSLDALLAAAGRAWGPRAAAASVRLDVAPSPVHVSTDAERLRQALDALMDNALRVLPAGSTIRLSCGPADSGHAWLAVEDDGPGLAEEDLAVAFERGRLTDRYRGSRPVGTGLGLALVGALATRLGGEARAGRSDLGGAAFVLFLPHPPPPPA